MITFMTKEYVKEQAALGEIPSMECSKLHHHQGATCSRGELIDAIEGNEFTLSIRMCACCMRLGCCSSNCLLRGEKAGRDGCCDGNFANADEAMTAFKSNPTPANFAAFQTAEKAVVKYIQAVIDKKKEPELDYSKPIVATKNGGMYLLVPTRRPESYEIVGYDWLDLKTGQANSCSCWKTQRKAIDCYNECVIKNVDLAIIEDAKQEKVGEKAKSAPEVKSEVKLRHLDYYHDGCNMVLVAKKDDMWLMHYPEWSSTVEQGEQGMIDRIGSCGYIRQGNLADDLTVKCEGFEIKRRGRHTIAVSLQDKGETVCIDESSTGDDIFLDLSDLDEFISGLMHMRNEIRSKT